MPDILYFQYHESKEDHDKLDYITNKTRDVEKFHATLKGTLTICAYADQVRSAVFCMLNEEDMPVEGYVRYIPEGNMQLLTSAMEELHPECELAKAPFDQLAITDNSSRLDTYKKAGFKEVYFLQPKRGAANKLSESSAEGDIKKTMPTPEYLKQFFESQREKHTPQYTLLLRTALSEYLKKNVVFFIHYEPHETWMNELLKRETAIDEKSYILFFGRLVPRTTEQGAFLTAALGNNIPEEESKYSFGPVMGYLNIISPKAAHLIQSSRQEKRPDILLPGIPKNGTIFKTGELHKIVYDLLPDNFPFFICIMDPKKKLKTLQPISEKYMTAVVEAARPFDDIAKEYSKQMQSLLTWYNKYALVGSSADQTPAPSVPVPAGDHDNDGEDGPDTPGKDLPVINAKYDQTPRGRLYYYVWWKFDDEKQFNELIRDPYRYPSRRGKLLAGYKELANKDLELTLRGDKSDGSVIGEYLGARGIVHGNREFECYVPRIELKPGEFIALGAARAKRWDWNTGEIRGFTRTVLSRFDNEKLLWRWDRWPKPGQQDQGEVNGKLIRLPITMGGRTIKDVNEEISDAEIYAILEQTNGVPNAEVMVQMHLQNGPTVNINGITDKKGGFSILNVKYNIPLTVTDKSLNAKLVFPKPGFMLTEEHKVQSVILFLGKGESTTPDVLINVMDDNRHRIPRQSPFDHEEAPGQFRSMSITSVGKNAFRIEKAAARAEIYYDVFLAPLGLVARPNKNESEHILKLLIEESSRQDALNLLQNNNIPGCIRIAGQGSTLNIKGSSKQEESISIDMDTQRIMQMLQKNMMYCLFCFAKSTPEAISEANLLDFNFIILGAKLLSITIPEKKFTASMPEKTKAEDILEEKGVMLTRLAVKEAKEKRAIDITNPLIKNEVVECHVHTEWAPSRNASMYSREPMPHGMITLTVQDKRFTKEKVTSSLNQRNEMFKLLLDKPKVQIPFEFYASHSTPKAQYAFTVRVSILQNGTLIGQEEITNLVVDFSPMAAKKEERLKQVITSIQKDINDIERDLAREGLTLHQEKEHSGDALKIVWYTEDEKKAVNHLLEHIKKLKQSIPEIVNIPEFKDADSFLRDVVAYMDGDMTKHDALKGKTIDEVYKKKELLVRALMRLITEEGT